MGTKLNPGRYDCHANAEPDEEMFVLLGRDSVAGETVRIWRLLRKLAGKDEPEIEADALRCSRKLDQWALTRGKMPLEGVEQVVYAWSSAKSLTDLTRLLDVLFEKYKQIEPDGDKETFASWLCDELGV